VKSFLARRVGWINGRWRVLEMVADSREGQVGSTSMMMETDRIMLVGKRRRGRALAACRLA
jgi:hypothetical protein